mmetsp:Transcript_46401/g.112484  ORF Transcript_46401/g.112484 Transcript_46401/m.112484 type:complete len:586 (+) Transcript_46401:79-1836(+)
MSNEEPPTKRRRRLDALGRLPGNQNSTQSPPSTSALSTPNHHNTKRSSLSGRGSLDGWTSCPLCGKYSKKKFALGKGIASHLLAIHTPWNPTKLSLKIERRKKEEQERQKHRRHEQKKKEEESKESNNDSTGSEANENPITSVPNTNLPKSSSFPTAPWTPSDAEREAWDAKILKILAELEQQQQHVLLLDENKTTDDPKQQEQQHGASNKGEHNSKAITTTTSQSQMLTTRTGSQTTSYRDSLPPFLDAAAKGDLDALQQMVTTTLPISDNNKRRRRISEIQKLLDTRDRHLSTAEHWAAGGGHLECLQYLRNLRRRHGNNDNDQGGSKNNNSSSTLKFDNEESSSDQTALPNHKLRRRDGKTSLHYAARNGHLNCVKYLIEEEGYQVEEVSGEGTRPLHMACFGGHLPVVQYLVEEQGADVHATNEWGCDAFHFVGLTICKPPPPPPTTNNNHHHNQSDAEEATTRTTRSTGLGDKDTTAKTTRIRDLCNYLRHACKVNLIRSQKQGHSILHKAAQKGNWHVLKWVADPIEDGGAGLSKEELTTRLGAPDLGGHCPSQIWRKFHGQTGKDKESVAEWMESLGW